MLLPIQLKNLLLHRKWIVIFLSYGPEKRREKTGIEITPVKSENLKLLGLFFTGGVISFLI